MSIPHSGRQSMYLGVMLFLFLGVSISLNAQQITIQRTHPIALPEASMVTNHRPALGTLDVIAVMVEFQPDTNRLTSGTGIFGSDGMQGLPYLTRQEDTRIDPLPHDQTYFETHLEFAKNYYEQSSDDQLTLNYRVLPQVYRLDQPMEYYSPIGEAFTTEKLAEFLRDVWAEVDERGGFDATGLNPDSTAFVVFHAGVGRDIELTGTSLDITPFDIPSIYMNKSNLQRWLGAGFDGFSVNNGTFRVTNSMIIPRTQSRRGEDIAGGEIVFPLSINGLLCASIGSHLGLPDLFNTETGDPAIGRFGLMDGAGFFSYNGLFPPQPSAWEKVWLGWQTPLVIPADSIATYSLAAAALDQPNSIVQIDLSSTEYFLVENRHRDPDGGGVVLTIRQPDGTELQQTFTNRDTDFIFQQNNFDTLLAAGTLINVDTFDWSLPGGIDVGEDGDENTADDRILNGGMLIWHIDEAVIREQLVNERVNADPDRRGVDLEEGDGAQDIGKNAGLLDNSPSFGYAFDFWWSGNDFRVITPTQTIDLNPDNEFGPDTYPDNNSNSGARSYFELFDFSDNLPVASFSIRPATTDDLPFVPLNTLNTGLTDLFTGIDPHWSFYPLGMQPLISGSDTTLVIPTPEELYLLPDPQSAEWTSSIDLGLNSPIQQPLISSVIVTGDKPGTATSLTYHAFDLSGNPIWQVTETANEGFISTIDQQQAELDFTGNALDFTDGSLRGRGLPWNFFSEPVNGSYVSIDNAAAFFPGDNIPIEMLTGDERFFGGTIRSGNSNLYYILTDKQLSVVDPERGPGLRLTVIFESDTVSWPAFSRSRKIFLVDRSDNTLKGFNEQGGILPGFPIPAPADMHFQGTPLLSDIDGDARQDILVIGQDDYSVNIFAFTLDGEPVEGFPLNVGGSLGSGLQPVHPAIIGNTLYALSHTGDLKAWTFPAMTTSDWPTSYGTAGNNKVTAVFDEPDTGGPAFSVLNPDETYNWPNPADEQTNIRFQVEEPGGTVEVTIIDFSGRTIFERTVTTGGGEPQEINIQTSNWGNGAYFAMVKATVDGREASKLIKIGVIH